MRNLTLALGLAFLAIAPWPGSSGDASAHDDGKVVRRDGGKTARTTRNKRNNRRGKKARGGDPRVGPFAKDDYPLAEVRRPLVLPAGMGEIELAVGGAGAGDGATWAIAPTAAVGIGDRLELGIGTDVTVAPDAAWSQRLAVGGHVLVADGRDLDFAPGLIVTPDLSGEGPLQMVVDAPFRYVMSKKSFLYFGRNALPIVFRDTGADATLVGNAGVGLQANARTALLADADLVRVGLSSDTGATGIWEQLRLNAALQYTPDRMIDVGARVGVTQTWDGSSPTGWTGQLYGAARF